MKIYTRAGDDGTTQLLQGARVRKDSLRLEVEGTLDELNAALGAAGSHLTDDRLAAHVTGLQRKLLTMGSLLAGAEEDEALLVFGEGEVTTLEQLIDELTAELPPLRSFILPGGSLAASQLHVARTVCRRLERRLTSLAAQEPVPALLQRFVNRLSDLLFVLARAANARSGQPDLEWKPRPKGGSSSAQEDGCPLRGKR